jgi:pimeloyl-ACP methyl ester carboxylesterase
MSETAALRIHLPAAGLQVHGLRGGPGHAAHAARPRLLLPLLHGWPECSHAWRPVMTRLADRFELVAPDLRGFGDTPPRRDLVPVLPPVNVGGWVGRFVARGMPDLLRHFLNHCSHQRAWIEPELERWVEQFMKPGRLQSGFDWHGSVHEARLAVIEGRALPSPPISLPTRVL